MANKVYEFQRIGRQGRVQEEGGGHNMCKAIRDLMDDSREEGRLEGRLEGREEGREEGRLEGREALLVTAKNFFANGVSYEIVRASIKDLNDEELRAIYEEVCV